MWISFYSSSSNTNINDSNSNAASINPPSSSTTASSTAVSNNANNTVPSEPITFSTALEAANAKGTTGKSEKKKYVPSSSFNEWLRPHVFGNNIALAKVDREQFQSKFDNAKSLDFEKRKLSAEETKVLTQVHSTFISEGFNNNLTLLARKGDTSGLHRYFIEDLIDCANDDPLVIAIRKGNRQSPIGKAWRKQKNLPSGRGGGTRNFHSGNDYWILTGSMVAKSVHEYIESGDMTIGGIQSMFYDGSGSFTILFDGTDTRETFIWHDLVDDPLAVMFYGSPYVTKRNFGQLFKDRTKHRSTRQQRKDYPPDIVVIRIEKL